MENLPLPMRSISDLMEALRKRTITSLELFEHCHEQNQKYQPTLNGYKTWNHISAGAQAAAADAAFCVGADLGALQGMPIAVKDVFGVEGLPTFAGAARRLASEWEREGPIMQRLRGQLGVFAGKIHTVEFALGVLGTNANWGTPRNPWDPNRHRVAGGSTSGAGVCLHEGSAVVAIGSDAGGSIRIPASLTGCVGIRTSIGRWPVGGALPLAPSLDTPGLVTRSVEDLAIACTSIDPTLGTWRPFLAEAERGSLASFRFGIGDSFFWDGCGPGVAEVVMKVVNEIARRGAEIREISMPETRLANEYATVGGLTVPEVFECVQALFPDRVSEIDPNVWTRLSTYGEISAREYLGRRRKIGELVTSATSRLEGIDAFLTPTTPITAPALDEVADLDGYRKSNVLMARNAYPMNLFDLCAITIPAGLDPGGLPVGIQMSAQRGRERELIFTALALERTIGAPRERLGIAPMCKP